MFALMTFSLDLVKSFSFFFKKKYCFFLLEMRMITYAIVS